VSVSDGGELIKPESWFEAIGEEASQDFVERDKVEFAGNIWFVADVVGDEGIEPDDNTDFSSELVGAKLSSDDSVVWSAFGEEDLGSKNFVGIAGMQYVCMTGLSSVLVGARRA
jgi:hypothetical protein